MARGFLVYHRIVNKTYLDLLLPVTVSITLRALMNVVRLRCLETAAEAVMIATENHILLFIVTRAMESHVAMLLDMKCHHQDLQDLVMVGEATTGFKKK